MKRFTLKQHKLSELEKNVIIFVLKNRALVLSMTIDELSKALFTSTATISRSCKALGYKGFQDMKFELNQLEKTTILSRQVTQHHLQASLLRVASEMSQTIGQIDEQKIHSAAGKIVNSNRIEFIGVGNSLFTCEESAKKLSNAGKYASAKSDWDDLFVTAKSLSESDLAILFSFSGETKIILEVMNILLEKKVKTVSITGHHQNSLAGLADLSFQPYILENRINGVDFTSRFPIQMIMDLIIIETMTMGTETTNSGAVIEHVHGVPLCGNTQR